MEDSRTICRVSELPTGRVLWIGEAILGITGVNIPGILNDCIARPVYGNQFDWELMEEAEFTTEQKNFFAECGYGEDDDEW